MRENAHSAERPAGILKWEAGHGVTLTQLEQMPGNVMHPDTFHFPVRFQEVEGACYGTLIEHFDPALVPRSIRAARELAAAGAKFISASCGFNILMQSELADAVDLPVCTSSLLQVPVVLRMLGRGAAVGVLTADRRHLTDAHLRQAGIVPEMPVFIAGIEDVGEFQKVRQDPDAVLDEARFRLEVVEAARGLVERHPSIRAIVLECTDLPPCSEAIRRGLGLPVFDYVTMLHWVNAATAG
jgi:hypothetical protein